MSCARPAIQWRSRAERTLMDRRKGPTAAGQLARIMRGGLANVA